MIAEPSEPNNEITETFQQLQLQQQDEEEEDIVKTLERCWRNERASPELQNNPEDLITEVIELIEFQSNRLANSSHSLNLPFLDCLYQMDLERIKFILKSFLRCRLAKIQRAWAEFWPTWTSQNRAEFLQSRLASFEKEFLQSFAGNVVATLHDSVLDKLPAKTATLDDEEMLATGSRPIATQNPASHVICRIRNDLGQVILDPISRATAPLLTNDIFVLQYSVIKDFLSTGEVELI